MFSVRTAPPRRHREEGEKPFWISFSDLMSALMVLFLVAMSVALLAVTKKVSTEEREDRERTEAIADLMGQIRGILTAKEFEGVRVNPTSIDFGPRGRFGNDQNTLSPDQRELLLSFTPKLLQTLRSHEPSKKWFRRVVVEGYASQSGSYLYNLNLSIERSIRVICELLRDAPDGPSRLTSSDRELVASTFFVGGASFNSLLKTDADSRRIEFKLEFKTRQDRDAEARRAPSTVDPDALRRSLATGERCPLVDRR
jgi:hypothetical protein